MGARISISFQNKNEEYLVPMEESVTLFNHWGGIEFVTEAEKYVKELKKNIKHNVISSGHPLGRLEPNTVMVNFIKWYTRNEDRITSNLYLGKNHDDGDNSDFGHHTINLERKT